MNRIINVEELKKQLDIKPDLSEYIVQDIDLRSLGIDWSSIKLLNTAFLGCEFLPADETVIREAGGLIYLHNRKLPYNPYRKALYTWQELMEGFDPKEDQSTDLKIYNHFSKSRFRPPITEALNQRIHDHAIDDALRQLLEVKDDGMTGKRVVGIMGGHSTSRKDPFYYKTALTAKLLTEAGFFIASGGGPGTMEAANLGAYFGGYSVAELHDAIQMLIPSPTYKDEGYFETALAVLEKYPKGKDNLAIPTWFYGHEPSNLFASHIAKYFSNSIREDNLLAVSIFGIVFAPGSAGTTQEIFMDATQNHYGTFNYFSPMVFLGKVRYSVETLIYPLLQQLSHGRNYHGLLHLTDEPEDIVQFLKSHPPLKKEMD